MMFVIIPEKLVWYKQLAAKAPGRNDILRGLAS